MIPDGFWLSLTAVLGLVMGSGVTALAHRVPRGQSWLHGRSACPSCGVQLQPLDLVPVLSWALRRGRCAHCGAPIAWRYPLTELLCGAWAVLLFLRVGIGWDYPFLALWGFLLIALMWIDLDVQLLPDVLTFPGTLLGVCAAALWPGGIREAIFGVVVGSGLLWLLAWGYQKVRGVEGMGFGDVKLAAMFGVVLGWPLTLLTLFLAAAAGSAWGLVLIARGQGHGQTALPFGTLLAPAALVSFLFGPPLMGWWFGLLRG